MNNNDSAPKISLDAIWGNKTPQVSSFLSLKNKEDKIAILREIGQKKEKRFSKILWELLEKNTDQKLRQEIVICLGELSEKPAINFLVEILFSTPQRELKSKIISIFGQFGPQREILDSLEHLLIWDQDLKIKIKSLEILGRFGSYLSLASFKKIYLTQESIEIKKRIIRILPQIEVEEAREFLVEQIQKERDLQILKEIIFSLGGIGNFSHFENFLTNFEKLPFETQHSLVWLLAKLDYKSHLKLVKLLLNKNLDQKIILEIIQLCGRFQIKESFWPLTKLLSFSNRKIKQEAIWALLNLKDSRTLPILQKRFKKEKMVEIRDELKKALNYISIV